MPIGRRWHSKCPLFRQIQWCVSHRWISRHSRATFQNVRFGCKTKSLAHRARTARIRNAGENNHGQNISEDDVILKDIPIYTAAKYFVSRAWLGRCRRTVEAPDSSTCMAILAPNPKACRRATRKAAIMDRPEKPARHPSRSPVHPTDRVRTRSAVPAHPVRPRRTVADDHGSRQAHDAAVSEGWPVPWHRRRRRKAARS